MSNLPNDLTKDHDLTAVAEALGMSERWVRKQVQNGAAHQRYGNKIRFTTEQVEALRQSFAQQPVSQSITTGRRRRSA